jgi:hypothetical protein
MFRKLNDKLLKIEKCTGVELTLLPDGGILLSGVVLKLEKNKIRKEKEFHFLSSYEELVRKTGVKAPLAITVSGKGILQKKLLLKDLTDRPVEMMLPNANPNEFYYTITPLEAVASVSVIRKEVLDKILADLLSHGFRILSLTIGLAGLPYLTPFLSAGTTPSVSTPQFVIRFDDRQQVSDIENLSFPGVQGYDKIEYNIGDQYVNSPALLAFGAATGLLASDPDGVPVIPMEALLRERENYTWFRYYRASAWALLTGLFTLLLVNFFIYNHYFSLNKDRQGVRLVSQEQEEKVKKLSATLRSKEDFLQQAGWEENSRLSYFADRIAGLVPSGTLLTGMQIHPLTVSLLGENAGTHFRKDTIQVAGTCDDPTELNQFTNNLKNIPDFKEVSIRNYAYKKEIRTGAFLMEIIVK